MELLKEFEKVDAMPIGKDVQHLDEPNNNIVNMIMAVYLRDSLYCREPRWQYAINCRRDNGELVRVMFNSRDWFFGRTPEGGIPQHPTKVTRNEFRTRTVGDIFMPVNVSEIVGRMTISELLQDICSWYVTFTREHNKDIIPTHKFVDVFNRSKTMPLLSYDAMIDAHSTWLGSAQEKMSDPNTSDYDYQRLTLEKSEYQSRINALLTVKYAMLFAEQERK